MTLREIRSGKPEVVYKDSQKLNQSRWARLLGIEPDIVRLVIYKENIRVEEARGWGGFQYLTPVGEFPKIVAALGQRKRAASGKTLHVWIADVDTTRDFQVTAPSGATLVYEHPKHKVIFRAVRRALRGFQR